MNLWEDRPDVAPLTFHPKIGQAAAELIGVEACRLWHDQALIKEAHGRKTDAHQDHPYWPIKETNSITAWIPFVKSTLDNGALGYIPGSHAVGLRKFVNIFFGEPQDILAEPEVQRHDAGLSRSAAGVGRVSSRPDGSPGRGEQDRHEPVRPHDHLFPRRIHPRLPLPALLGRPRQHRGGRADRQRRHADRLAAAHWGAHSASCRRRRSSSIPPSRTPAPTRCATSAHDRPGSRWPTTLLRKLAWCSAAPSGCWPAPQRRSSSASRVLASSAHCRDRGHRRDSDEPGRIRSRTRRSGTRIQRRRARRRVPAHSRRRLEHRRIRFPGCPPAQIR